MITVRRALAGMCLVLLVAAAPVGAQGQGVYISLNIPSVRLTLYVDSVREGVYTVSVGRPGQPTPRGTFHIASKLVDPWWYPTDGRAPVPPGSGNPLGRWWMGLSLPRYGLHGTNDEATIGGYASAGCVRMYNRDAAKLFELVSKGTPVTITYHTAMLQANGRLWAYGETGVSLLEVGLPDDRRLWLYSDIYRLAPVSAVALAPLTEAAGVQFDPEELGWLAGQTPVDYAPGAVVRFNGWMLGRGRLVTARGVWLPWDVVAPAFGLERAQPPADARAFDGRIWTTVDDLGRAVGLSLGCRWSDEAADLTGVAVVLRDRFLTGAAYIEDGRAFVLASSVEPGREPVFTPVRRLAGLLGLEVQWDAERWTVFLR